MVWPANFIYKPLVTIILYFIVGYRMCHNNLLNILDLNVYGLNHDCNPNGIDYNFTYEMGYGRAFDRLGNIYSVRLFYTSQESLYYFYSV